jgi:hypothetical protein
MPKPTTAAAPTCPLCGSARVEEQGKAGTDNQVTVLQCVTCSLNWREIISDVPDGEPDE